MSIKNIMQER